jgi:hypothetical protein
MLHSLSLLLACCTPPAYCLFDVLLQLTACLLACLLYSSSLLLLWCTPPAYCLLAVLLKLTAILLFACFCRYYSLVTALNPPRLLVIQPRNGHAPQETCHVVTIQPVYWRQLHEHTANTPCDRYLLLCDVTVDTKNTASSIVACWTVFTELLPGNALIKSVTIYSVWYTLWRIYPLLGNESVNTFRRSVRMQQKDAHC